MRLRRKLTIAATALAAATALNLPTGPLHTATASAATCTPTWKLHDLPAGIPAVDFESLSVSSLSSDDTWITAGAKAQTAPAVLRWDGRSLSPAQTMALPPQGHLALGKTSFASDTEGWALTTYIGTFNADQRIGEHWHDGHWTMTPLAVPSDAGRTVIQQTGVATLSATDAWTVGGLYTGAPGVEIGPLSALGAVIEHWDGTQWSVVPNPASDQKLTFLTSITARSASNVWAVGTQFSSSGITPLIEHYDGTSWKVTPTPPATNQHLTSVTATSPTDAWAVGDQLLNNQTQPLVEQFDGTSWHVVTGLPDLKGVSPKIVTASNPNDVWAIATNPESALERGDPISTNLLLHFDGTSWTTATLPSPSGFGLFTLYTAMSGTAPDDVWAAGTYRFSDLIFHPLLAHLSCGKA